MANAIRALAMDAVQQANSGHPGAPMGMAEIAVALWGRHLRHNPANPRWANRDRFVLSNGHGSMLQYALLHLTGYELPIEELKAFRQLHSRTPGHPEVDVTPGIETTTGPLGQGQPIAMREAAEASDNVGVVECIFQVVGVAEARNSSTQRSWSGNSSECMKGMYRNSSSAGSIRLSAPRSMARPATSRAIWSVA